VEVEEKLPSPTTLYKAVEKDGVWLITLNTAHPLVAMVAEARHKAASAVLTYMVFALATAADATRNGEDLVEKVSATLASILGQTAA
jgi:hypothetical protein